MYWFKIFTVYGPYGRPDMFIPKILNKIKSNKVINLFNAGKHSRDFTYVKDIAQLIGKIIINYQKKKRFLIFVAAKE